MSELSDRLSRVIRRLHARTLERDADKIERQAARAHREAFARVEVAEMRSKAKRLREESR